MKYILYSLLASMLVIGLACSDKRKNEDVFSEFEGERGVYMVKLPPAMFMSLIGMDSNEIEKDEIGDINFVKLLVYSRENNDAAETDKMLQRLNGKMSEFEYENIMALNSGKTYVSAYILENEDYVSDFMLILKENDSLVCLGLSGKLDGRQLFKFATEIEYDKFQDFIKEK
ncbi:MAG: DUF4252 domain-containing protein [Bacteroidales bacterium]|nr:DUF4252 domain-containing protein [Bacteroidales bacterium]